MQVRNDISTGRLPCSFMSRALLGSYLVQSELGDFDEDHHKSGYLSAFEFAPNNTPELEEKVAELHKQHRGQSSAEAELHYLETAKKLAMYGVELYPATDSSGVQMMLGVSAAGLLVYRDRLRIQRIQWPKISSFSYKKSRFLMRIRPSNPDELETMIEFKLASNKLTEIFWKICVEHHTFFRYNINNL